MTPDTPFDLLVAGEINPDLILSGDVVPTFGQVEKLVDSADLTIGSSSVIFACGAARLGLKVAFIGKCGDDVFGRFMLEEMQKRGVEIRHVIVVPGGSTGLSVILNRGVDRAILTHPGLIPALRAEDIPDSLLHQAWHLHVASYFLQPYLQKGLPELFEKARSFGLTTSLDTNYDPLEQWQGFDRLLSVTNIFLPNEAEAKSLAAEEDVNDAADILSGKVDTLGIKLGAVGALGIRHGEKIMVPSIPVRLVDTVGAGDSFDAGFIYGVLQGWPLEKALRVGTICGALSTREAGGTTAQPTLDEILDYLK
jgi:sugar/nucleoside kinase (ribokinase family)